MAVKSDINLFRAAGGERAKARKMPLTKKMGIVVLVVVLVVAVAIGGLYYYNSILQKQLKEQQELRDAYAITQAANRSVLQEFSALRQEVQTAVALEYSTQMTPGFFTDLSVEELTAVRQYLTEGGNSAFDYNNRFDEVSDAVLTNMVVSQYSDYAGEDFVESAHAVRFLYSALCYMKETQNIVRALPMQDPDQTGAPVWYCYYRGKMILFLHAPATVDDSAAATVVAGLKDKATLGLADSPFADVYPDDTSLDLNDTSTMHYVTTVGEDKYMVAALTCKSVFERFVDVVENRFAMAEAVEYPGTYTLTKPTFEKASSLLKMTVTMTQTDVFGLIDVCHALDASPFFHAEKDFAYEISSVNGEVTAELVFRVVNKACEAMAEVAANEFVGVEE